MKILLVNTYCFMFGGAEKYFFDLSSLLEKHGHKVISFCMQHPKNIKWEYEKYFVTYFPSFKEMSFKKKLKFLFRFFYNFEARRKFRKLIQDEKPDLIHINNISIELTHSIILEAKKQKLPIAMTIHDYRIICPQTAMLCKKNICDKCKHGSFFYCMRYKCIDGNLLKSFLLTLFYYFNNLILRSLNNIDLFIFPSLDLKERFEKIRKYINSKAVVLHHPIDIQEDQPNYNFSERNIVYFGRLSKEKGIEFLLEAVKGLEVNLKVIGTGPSEEVLKKKVINENIGNVDFLGFLSRDRIKEEISRSLFSVVPSIWFEVFSYATAESFGLGKPVLASNIGALPELVKSGITGYLFEPGSSESLREGIIYLLNNINLVSLMGRQAKKWVECNLNPENYYNNLIKQYERLIQLQQHVN